MTLLKYILVFCVILVGVMIFSIAPGLIHGDDDSRKSEFVVAWISSSILAAIFAIVALYLKGWGL